MFGLRSARISQMEFAPAREMIGDAHDARRNSTTVLSELYRASAAADGEASASTPSRCTEACQLPGSPLTWYT